MSRKWAYYKIRRDIDFKKFISFFYNFINYIDFTKL